MTQTQLIEWAQAETNKDMEELRESVRKDLEQYGPAGIEKEIENLLACCEVLYFSLHTLEAENERMFTTLVENNLV